MNYLELARRAVLDTKETKEPRSGRPVGGGDGSPGYERNEFNERSPRESIQDSDPLKSRIVAAATVETQHFDRATYDALWREWEQENAQ